MTDTPAATLKALGKLYNDASAVSDAVLKHLRTVPPSSELFAVLQRVQIELADFRHAMSGELQQAIHTASQSN